MFKQLAQALFPRTIGEITWEARTENMLFNVVVVALDDDTEQQEIKVNHIIFQNWLNDTGYLDWVRDFEKEGEHQQDTGKHSYITFIDEMLTDKIAYNFLKETGLAFEPFNPDLI